MNSMSSDAATLAPVLLLSMPQMLDPNFSRSVVLLAEYGRHGAFGEGKGNRAVAGVHPQVTEARKPLVRFPQ